MIKYAVEKINKELLEELDVILRLHWKEIAMYKDKIKYNPDYEAYFAMDAKDALHIVTVRKDAKIIGYYISFIYNHPHYKDDKMAQNDVLFIHPDYRGGTLAYRMFKFAEEELRKLGCSVMMLHMKVNFPFENLCKKLDMDKQEIIYSKYLGE